MEQALLDPGGYGGSYKFVGGRLCLDLVNTVSWPDDPRRHDWLDVYANLISWADRAGIVDSDEAATLQSVGISDPDRAARVVAGVRRQREVLELIFGAVAREEPPPGAAIDELNTLLAEATVRRRLSGTPLRWSWAKVEEPEQLMASVVYDAADLLADGDHSRLGYCSACNWLFYDTTRNRSRRWCDMADCGSRDKARSYYRRTTGS